LGVNRLVDVLDGIRRGRAKEQDIELLEDLAWLLKDTSGCDRGRQAALPVLSALRYFRDEFLTHVRERRCPARVCRELISFEIDPLLCDGCGACVPACGSDAMVGEPGRSHVIAQARCNRCGACVEVCACDAVLVL
jgi:NADH-quinone oxidoreductase subunit F